MVPSTPFATSGLRRLCLGCLFMHKTLELGKKFLHKGRVHHLLQLYNLRPAFVKRKEDGIVVCPVSKRSFAGRECVHGGLVLQHIMHDFMNGKLMV